jgi:hypothetical protein
VIIYLRGFNRRYGARGYKNGLTDYSARFERSGVFLELLNLELPSGKNLEL